MILTSLEFPFIAYTITPYASLFQKDAHAKGIICFKFVLIKSLKSNLLGIYINFNSQHIRKK